jgi:hypothetical protein
MARDINLDGSEVTIIKALGLSGSEVDGDSLMKKIPELMFAELADTLRGLISMGYVSSDKGAFYSEEEFKRVHFQINSGYSKDLREALDPQPQKQKSRRVRRE